MNKIKLLLFITFLSANYLFSQSKTDQYKQINKQVWEPFTEAFETLDSELFSSLHSDDLIRVNADGKSAQGKKAYITGYKERWTNISRKQTISFRFFERINNNASASERGIYKLTINPNTTEEQSYYGKFHVFLRKENAIWKITIDYDSSEENTINNTSYESAFAMNDYDKY